MIRERKGFCIHIANAVSNFDVAGNILNTGVAQSSESQSEFYANAPSPIDSRIVPPLTILTSS